MMAKLVLKLYAIIKRKRKPVVLSCSSLERLVKTWSRFSTSRSLLRFKKLMLVVRVCLMRASLNRSKSSELHPINSHNSSTMELML